MDNNHPSGFQESRAQALARLAVLQRLKEQAEHGNRAAMLKSIEQLIDSETAHLRRAPQTVSQDRDHLTRDAG